MQSAVVSESKNQDSAILFYLLQVSLFSSHPSYAFHETTKWEKELPWLCHATKNESKETAEEFFAKEETVETRSPVSVIFTIFCIATRYRPWHAATSLPPLVG